MWKRLVTWWKNWWKNDPSRVPAMPTPDGPILTPDQWRDTVRIIILTRGWNEDAKHLLVAHDQALRAEVLRLQRVEKRL